MKSNALVVAEPGRLERRELEVPEPSAGEVLVRIELSGICGSDVHLFNGGMDLDFPVLPGHEVAGRIETLGEGTTTDATGEPVAEGDPVTIVPGNVCGECWYCNNVPSRPTACEDRTVYGFLNVEYGQHAHGGFSEYMLVDEGASFYKLPDGMDVELGALVEPVAVATRAFERGHRGGIPDAREGFGIGKSVTVQGAGPIGLLTMSAAKAAGAGQVIAVDAIGERLDLAESFGATDTVDLTEYEDDEALTAAVKGLTNGDVGSDLVIEAAGVPVALRQGIEFARDGGTLVEAGHYAYNGEVEINPTRIVQKDLDLYGSLAYPPNQFETAIALIDQLEGEVPFGQLFNYRADFDDAEAAYERQESGEAYRATIHPSGI